MSTGEQLGFEGMERAMNAVQPWPEQALQAITELAEQGLPFTSEDVITLVGLPRGEIGTNQNNAVGAVMAAAHRAGITRRIGYQPAARRESHGAIVAVWIGA